LKTLPGVNSNNELSTICRTGWKWWEFSLCKWDRNLPSFPDTFGQQEGLSFTNTDLVQNVEFSALKQIWR
jgi:hypothetical protein